jgi:hypothetical protein
VVLDDRALVTARNLIKPPPNQFTHQVTHAQPYFFEDRKGSADGEFPAGSLVVLLVHDGGPDCRVVDGQGLYVLTAFSGLKAIPRR